MSLSYTTGNPSNLTAGATASMNDIAGPFADIKTFLTDGAVSIGTTLIAANAVTAAKIEVQQAWQTITLVATGWSSSTLSYYKDSLGIVHLRGDAQGAITGGGVSAGATLGTLPAGARPVSTQVFPLCIATGTLTSAASFSVSAAGVIVSVHNLGTAGVTYSLGAGHFRAEN